MVQAIQTRTPPEKGSVAKRGAIIQAATELFLRDGFGPTSMDEVARTAAVSKQTIYHHFGNKEMLFAAIVRDLSQDLLDTTAFEAKGDIRAVLRGLGFYLLDLAMQADSLAMHRLIIAESARFPELGQIAYASGARPSIQALARYLANQSRSGVLAVADAEFAAEQFFGLVLGQLHLRALICGERPGKRRLHAWVDGAVETFLHGHRRHLGQLPEEDEAQG